MPLDLKGEVLWEARRRRIEADFSLAVPLAKHSSIDPWTLRRMVVLAIDSGGRLDFARAFSKLQS